MSKKKNKNQKAVNVQKKKSKKSIIQILIEWLTWQKVGVIIAGIGVLVSIIIFWFSKPTPPSEIETIKSEIQKDIDIIENSFKPNDLLEKDSLIADFENNSLKLVSLWKIINEPISYKALADKDLSDLYNVLKQDQARLDQYYAFWEKISRNLIDIRSIEMSKGIDDANSVLSINKLTELQQFLYDKREISHKHMDACIDYLNKAVQYKPGKRQKQLYLKACEELDLIKADPDFYKCDKALFDFIIQTNKLYLSKNQL